MRAQLPQPPAAAGGTLRRRSGQRSAAAAVIGLRTSSMLHGPFLMLGSRWLCQRSRHCLPMRPGRCLAIADHFCGPRSVTSVRIFSSSSVVHGPLITCGSRTLRQRCRHWIAVLFSSPSAVDFQLRLACLATPRRSSWSSASLHSSDARRAPPVLARVLPAVLGRPVLAAGVGGLCFGIEIDSERSAEAGASTMTSGTSAATKSVGMIIDVRVFSSPPSDSRSDSDPNMSAIASRCAPKGLGDRLMWTRLAAAMSSGVGGGFMVSPSRAGLLGVFILRRGAPEPRLAISRNCRSQFMAAPKN